MTEENERACEPAAERNCLIDVGLLKLNALPQRNQQDSDARIIPIVEDVISHD